VSYATAGRRWQAIVLSWNGREDTLRCLTSLRTLGDELNVICVDHGSVDGTAAAVREQFPEVTLIEAGSNLGYSGGNNLGIRHALEAGARWVMLVNNDATVEADVTDGFEAAAQSRPDAGILAGTVLTTDEPPRIWFAGQRVNLRLGYSGRPRGYGRPDGPAYARTLDTDRAVGALMAISRQAITAVGLLDEELFAYVEDVDLAIRARQAGFAVVVAPRARAHHRVSASTGGEAASTHTLYYGVRNTIVVFERHAPLGRLGTLTRRAVILATFGAHALTRADRRAALAAVREGFSDARAGRLGPRR
jgi:GT2 family glycosyltransferase